MKSITISQQRRPFKKFNAATQEYEGREYLPATVEGVTVLLPLSELYFGIKPTLRLSFHLSGGKDTLAVAANDRTYMVLPESWSVKGINSFLGTTDWELLKACVATSKGAVEINNVVRLGGKDADAPRNDGLDCQT
jgi:hypothetical protein